MKKILTILSFLVILSETNCFYIQNTSYSEDIERHAVILRKLQNLQEHDSRKSTRTAKWSEILADIIVQEIFSHKNFDTDKHINKPPEKSTSVLVKTISHVLEVYKIYVFDKLRSSYSKVKVNISYTDQATSQNRVEKSISESRNPKEDVEIIEPKYHGKLRNGTIEVDTASDCGEGFKKNDAGECVELKHSKFVLSIPWQCPVGYRADWLGYCRPSL